MLELPSEFNYYRVECSPMCESGADADTNFTGDNPALPFPPKVVPGVVPAV